MRKVLLIATVVASVFLSCETDKEEDDSLVFTGLKNCLFLDGNNDYGKIEYNQNLDLINTITIESKIYIAEFNESKSSSWRWDEAPEPILPIISQSHDRSSVGDYTFGVTPTRALFAFETVDCRFSVDFSFETEKWYNIAVVHTLGNSEETRIYIDGEPYQGIWEGDNGDPIDANDMSIPNSGNPYWIGTNWKHGVADSPDEGVFNGYIDDLSIWNVIRTEEQISNDFANGIDTNEEGLVSFWLFNELDGDKIVDQKSSNDITLCDGAMVYVE